MGIEADHSELDKYILGEDTRAEASAIYNDELSPAVITKNKQVSGHDEMNPNEMKNPNSSTSVVSPNLLSGISNKDLNFTQKMNFQSANKLECSTTNVNGATASLSASKGDITLKHEEPTNITLEILQTNINETLTDSATHKSDPR